MSLVFCSAYSTDTVGELTGFVAISGSSYFLPFVSQASQYFTGFSCSIDEYNYDDALVSIQTAINSVPSLTTSIRYDLNSGYVILSSSVSAIWQFSSGSQRVLGFNPTYTTLTNVITGAFKPWFIWTATNPKVTNDTEIYENIAVYNERIADSGRTYSVGSDRTTNFEDWSFTVEPKSNVFADKATATKPFTYDLFLKNLRKGPYPFVVFDTTLLTSSFNYSLREGTYEMRAEGFQLKPRKYFDDYYDYWNLDFKTRLISRPSSDPSNDFGSLPVTASNSTPASISNMIFWLNSEQSGLTYDVNGYNANLHTAISLDPLKANFIGSGSNILLRQPNAYSPFDKPAFSLNVFYPDIVTNSLPYVVAAQTNYTETPTGFSFVLIGSFNQQLYYGNTRSLAEFFDFSINQPTARILQHTNSQKLAIELQDINLGTTYVTSSNLLANQPFVAISTFDFDEGVLKLFINDSTSSTGYMSDKGYSFKLTSSICLLGSPVLSKGGLYSPDIDFVDLLAYSKKLSMQEINTILDYANYTYNLSNSLIQSTSSFTPDSLPNLKLWLETDYGVSLSGSAVTGWLDKKNGIQFGQATTGSRPTYNASDSNHGNHPSIVFDGVDALTASANAINYNSGSCYIVYKNNASIGDHRLYAIRHATSTPTNQYHMILLQAATPFISQMYTALGTTARTVGTFPTSASIITTQYNFIAQSGSAIPSFYFNASSTGSLTTTTAPSASLPLANFERQIGYSYGGTYACSGSIAAILEYGELHNQTQINQVTNYLKRKYKARWSGDLP